MTKSIVTTACFGLAVNVVAQQPNIVYILTDQQTASAMSCSGNNELKTPNIDRLAAEGIRFTNAYCSSPLSTPSRASMFTGLFSGNTQMLVNGSFIDKAIRPQTLGNLLKNAGYDCAYGGKWHLPTNSIETDEWGFRVLHPYEDKGLATACVGYLAEKHDKPFFMVASYINPHNICQYARGEELPEAKVVASPLADCPKLPANFAIAPFEPDAIRKAQRANKSAYPTLNFTEDDWRRYRDTYYRLVEHIDVEVGEIITALEKNGQLENTLILFSSDHGDGVGAHHWNQKSILYEEVVNIPLIVRLPKAKNAGAMKAQLVNNGPDFFATVCDYAGATVPEQCKGKSLKPILENKSNTSELHPYIVTESLFDKGILYGWMVRTKDYKYVVYSTGELREQLFDMKKDKGEMINLAVQQEYTNQLAQYRQMLVDWKKENRVEYKK